MAGLKPLLKDIADAIRAKSGTTAVIPASEFADEIGHLYVVSDEAVFEGDLSVASTGEKSVVSTVRQDISNRATFDGKTLTVPMKIRLSCNGTNREGSFNIVVSFE